MDQQLKVLVVDDSFEMRDEIKNAFEQLGHDVVGECGNGVEALELVQQLKPDLVSLDIIMPEMDGIECYRSLRLLPKPPHCILVSALASEPRVLAAYENEIMVSHYLSKPIRVDELKLKIAEVFSTPSLPAPVPRTDADDEHP